MYTLNVSHMYKNDGVTRRYSESFKLKILAVLEIILKDNWLVSMDYNPALLING